MWLGARWTMAFAKEPTLVVTSVENGDAGEAGLPDELGMIERGALTPRLHDQGRKIPKAGAGLGGVEWCCRRNDR